MQKAGKRIEPKIFYFLEEEKIEIGQDDVKQVKSFFNASVIGTIMKGMEVELTTELPFVPIYFENTVTYGNNSATKTIGPYFLKEKATFNADTKTYSHKIYDEFIKTMVDYKPITINYPTTINEFFKQLCVECNLVTEIDSLPNGDKIIDHDIYSDIGFTFRDVFTDIGQATATLFEIRDKKIIKCEFGTNNIIINDDILKNQNISLGKHFGPINSIVLSRSADSDFIYKRDETLSQWNELKISDNQLMNDNNRADFLDVLYSNLYGIEYDIFDLELVGYGGFNPLDKIEIQTGGKSYYSYIFNNEEIYTQGYSENIYTEMPSETNSDYSVSDTDDRKMKQIYLVVNKQEQRLIALAEETDKTSKKQTQFQLDLDGIKEEVSYFDDQAQNIAQLTIDLESIKQQIGSITDTTVSANGVGSIFLDNVKASEVLYLRIYPTSEDLSYLYPNEDLEPAEDLEPLSRDLLFINRDTKKTVRWTLPCDLLYISDTVKDELIVDYENSQLFCIHRVGINSSGKNYALASETTEYFDWQSIVLEDGDYDVKMESFTSAYIYARTLAQNLYTDQFATRVELNASIELLNQSITLDVNQKVTLINKDIEELDGRITTTATEIEAKVSKKVDNESFIAYQKITNNAIENCVTTSSFQSYQTQTDKAIESRVTTSAFSTYQTQTAKEISSKVSSGSIISTINQSAEKVKIDANKLELSANNVLDIISGNTINLKSKNITITSDKFKVTSDGNITASGGTIGGWTITSDTLYNTSSGISSNTSKYAFWAGESNSAHGSSTTNAKFKVGHDGSMIATGASVSGTITATTISCTNGTFAGWNVTSNGLSGERLNLNSKDGAIEIYPVSGGKILFNNGIRLAVPKGVMITSSSSGDRTAPSNGDLNLVAGLGRSVYLASRSGDRDNDVEYQCITITSSSVQANWQNISTSSSRATKENITILEKSSIDEIYNLVRNLDFYQYDYKKNYSGRKENVGFLIEDIEGTILEKYLHVYKSKTDKNYKNYNSEDLTRILLLIVQQLQKQLEEIRKKVME